MRWYLITPECSFGMEHPHSIPEVYEQGRVLPTGTVIPENFKGIQDIDNLYLPMNRLIEIIPEERELPILYMLWPNTRPKDYQAKLYEEFAPKWAWYKLMGKVCEEGGNISDRRCSISYGVSALMDIEGICKKGDTALVGDIVPAAFFSGLDISQFEQLQRMGAVHHQWLEPYAPQFRAEYMRVLAWPVIRQIAPTKAEREVLYQKFPAANPEISVPEQEEAIPAKSRKLAKKG